LEAQTRYHPNAEQLALASTIEESVAPLLPLSRVHASHVEDARTWSGLEEIGIFGITVAQEQGGSGLGAAEETLIVLSLGQRLVAPAVLATIGAAHAVVEPSAQMLGKGLAGPGAAGLAGGRRVAAGYRRGERTIIVEEPGAQFVLVRDRDEAALYELGSCELRTVDDRLWLAGLAEVVGSGAAVLAAARGAGAVTRPGAATLLGELPGLGAPIARFDAPQMLRLRLIDAAALAGIAQAALDMAVAYAGTRTQFGRPIGSQQAVKHHCANMAIAARAARDQTSFAAVAVDEGRDDAALQVECALFVAGSAAVENAGKNIQIHGGIGFSDEADPHMLVKRAQLLTTIGGGLEAANARIADIKWGG
jgi:alkylation response protein AidB-like acyl-CoA dehydrogenase